jgi:FtsH-binding integral membrane protein
VTPTKKRKLRMSKTPSPWPRKVSKITPATKTQNDHIKILFLFFYSWESVYERASKNERKCLRNFYLSFSSSFLFCVFAATVSFFMTKKQNHRKRFPILLHTIFFLLLFIKQQQKKQVKIKFQFCFPFKMFKGSAVPIEC